MFRLKMLPYWFLFLGGISLVFQFLKLVFVGLTGDDPRGLLADFDKEIFKTLLSIGFLLLYMALKREINEL